MIPPPINDQQAIECLGAILVPLTNGVFTTPVQTHCAVLLVDYGVQKKMAPGAVMPSVEMSKADFQKSLIACHAANDPHSINWPVLLQTIITLLNAVVPIVSGVLAQMPPPKP